MKLDCVFIKLAFLKRNPHYLVFVHVFEGLMIFRGNKYLLICHEQFINSLLIAMSRKYSFVLDPKTPQFLVHSGPHRTSQHNSSSKKLDTKIVFCSFRAKLCLKKVSPWIKLKASFQ